MNVWPPNPPLPNPTCVYYKRSITGAQLVNFKGGGAGIYNRILLCIALVQVSNVSHGLSNSVKCRRGRNPPAPPPAPP